MKKLSDGTVSNNQFGSSNAKKKNSQLSQINEHQEDNLIVHFDSFCLKCGDKYILFKLIL